MLATGKKHSLMYLICRSESNNQIKIIKYKVIKYIYIRPISFLIFEHEFILQAILQLYFTENVIKRLNKGKITKI